MSTRMCFKEDVWRRALSCGVPTGSLLFTHIPTVAHSDF